MQRGLITGYSVTDNFGIRQLSISAHAPAKGATISCSSYLATNLYFNPRTREGCDIMALARRGLSSHFNPRTREGCDTRASASNGDLSFISIHAPAKGATDVQDR